MDPNIDPELALALRVSMEEERARQEAAAKKAADEAGGQKGKDGDAASASQETVARTSEKNAEPMVSCYSCFATGRDCLSYKFFLQLEKNNICGRMRTMRC